jgi:translation initiation factor IF-3
VDPDGQQLGIKPLSEALAIAASLDLDLVEVAPMANPPVCRIMDYGKFKFDEAQRARESRRKTVHLGVKEMKYRPKIGPGDFETKTRQVAKFLEDGHKVKITIMFRGREVYHPELGKRILDRIAEQMEGSAKIESEPRLDGRNMVMVLTPDKRARQSAASRAKAQGAEKSQGGSGTSREGQGREGQGRSDVVGGPENNGATPGRRTRASTSETREPARSASGSTRASGDRATETPRTSGMSSEREE